MHCGGTHCTAQLGRASSSHAIPSDSNVHRYRSITPPSAATEQTWWGGQPLLILRLQLGSSGSSCQAGMGHLPQGLAPRQPWAGARPRGRPLCFALQGGGQQGGLRQLACQPACMQQHSWVSRGVCLPGWPQNGLSPTPWRAQNSSQPFRSRQSNGRLQSMKSDASAACCCSD